MGNGNFIIVIGIITILGNTVYFSDIEPVMWAGGLLIREKFGTK